MLWENILFIAYYQTNIGKIGIAEEDGSLTHVNINPQKWPAGCFEQETPLLAEAARQIKEYLAGKRKTFNLPLSPKGTAVKVASPLGCRAIGMANNKNPIGIIVPCHRVIGSNGKLIGYAGGLDIKAKLLNLEQQYK